MRTLAVVFLAILAVSFPAGPAAGKDKEKLVVTPGEKKDDVEVLNCSPKGYALLHVPAGLDASKKPGLLVALHGDGSSADHMLMQEFAAHRKWAVLAPQGRIDVATPQGPGHRWDDADAAVIAGLAKWCVQNRGIDPAQVVLFGHSAGGMMAFAAYPADPSVFAGLMTCSAPGAPDKRHETTRCCVFLGTKDPNFPDAKSVQNQMKKDAGRLVLTVVEDAEHNDLPETPYLDVALDWILAKGAVGRETRVPKKPPAAAAAGLRHVLLRWKGAAGAPAELKRSKEAAKSAADDLLKRLRAGKASFGLEAQALSEDDASRPLGGAIDAERLAGFGGAAASAKDAPKGADAWSGPFESPAGWHVVEREQP